MSEEDFIERIKQYQIDLLDKFGSLEEFKQPLEKAFEWDLNSLRD